MARPAIPVGTYGKITTTQIAADTWEARTRFRMPDGSYKRPRKTGPSATKAENNLKTHMIGLANESKTGVINADSRFTFVANKWYEEISREAERGHRADTEVASIRGWLDNWILPMVGDLRMREITVMGLQAITEKGLEERSYATAKKLRNTLSSVCGYAVRHRAIDFNPVPSIAKLHKGEPKQIVTLTLPQRLDMLTKLRAYTETRLVDKNGRQLGLRGRIWRQLPDIVEAMLATGGRIGEILALTGDDVDPTGKTVSLDYHLVRVRGKGIVRKLNRKGGKAGLTLAVPSWSLPMWRRLKIASGGGRLFMNIAGGWLDLTNAETCLRQAFNAAGYTTVRSHVLRKTVATMLDEADLPTTAIADQLGNSPAVVERHYRGRRVANAAAADALEGMLGS